MDAFKGLTLTETHTKETMQSTQFFEPVARESRRVLNRMKREAMKLSKLIPTSVQSSMAVSSTLKDTSLRLTEVSSLALAESAIVLREQQKETLSKLLRGSARFLMVQSSQQANGLVDSWMENAKAQRDELMRENVVPDIITSDLQSTSQAETITQGETATQAETATQVETTTQADTNETAATQVDTSNDDNAQ